MQLLKIFLITHNERAKLRARCGYVGFCYQLMITFSVSLSKMWILFASRAH